MSCEICHAIEPKYRCPACGCRTCSSKCIQSHKTASNCTGQRNRAAYIPPNEYGYGALMDDYAYLEEMGRNVQEAQKGSGRLKRQRRNELDWVKKCREKGIEVIVLADGMEKRKKNQTCWKDKGAMVHFTITYELSIYGERPQLVTHGSPGTSILSDLLSKPLADGRIAKKVTKDQLKLLRDAHASNQLRYLIQYMGDPRTAEFEVPEKKLPPAHPSLPAKPTFNAFPTSTTAEAVPELNIRKVAKQSYFVMEPQGRLIDEMEGCTLLEWPIIQVWLADELEEAQREGKLELLNRPTRRAVKPPPVVQQTQQAPSTALNGLGDYGSESEMEEDQVARSLLVS